MRCAVIFTTLLFAAPLGSAPAPVYREPSDRVFRSGILGAWKMTPPVYQISTSIASWQHTVFIGKDTWAVVRGKNVAVFSLHLDGRREPATIDVVGPKQGMEVEWRGLVRLDGDTLTVALSYGLTSDGPVPRPTGFRRDVIAPDGRPATVLVFHRVK